MPISIKCKVCSNTRLYPPSQVARGGIYCSVKCRDVGISQKRTAARLTSKCLICSNQFYTTKYKLARGYSKFCSKVCTGESRRRYPIAPFKGRKHTPETIEKLRLNHNSLTTPKGRDHYNWKDVGLGYSGIHERVRKMYGRQSLCEHCGATEAIRFEWANVSGEYSLERSDWLRLCKSCHNKFDIKNPKKPNIKFGFVFRTRKRTS